MMKSSLKFVLLFWLGCNSGLIAQIANIQGMSNELIRERKYAEIDGSPYLFPTWLPGDLYDKEGNVTSNVLIKYDTYKDKIEVNQNGSIIEVFPAQYSGFSINEVENNTNAIKKHSFKIFESFPGLKGFVFMEVLYSGDFTLLKKHSTEFLQENVTNYGTSTVVKRFQSKVVYYVKTKESAFEVKPNKSSLKEVFAEKSELIKSMKIRNEGDLTKFVEALNNK